MPSASVCESGFSQKMSFFALAAGIAANRVPVVRRGDANGVDIRAGEQVAEILVGLAVLVVVFLVHAVGGRLEVVRINVGDGQHAAIVVAQEVAQIAAALPADADRSHGDLLRGGIRSEEATGQDEGDRCRSGGFQGITASNFGSA